LKAVHESTVHARVQSDGKARLDADAADRQRGEAAAAKAALEAEQRWQLEMETLRQAAAAAVATAVEKERALHGLQTAHGMAKKELEQLRQAEVKRAAAGGSEATTRQRLAELTKEVEAARALVPELREKVRSLEAQLETQRRAAPAETTIKLIAPRTSNSPNAPLTARASEYMRRLVEECNVSFEGAHTAVALVLGMFMEGGPTEAQLSHRVRCKCSSATSICYVRRLGP
jgi:chromosome segregation ATPase